MFLNAKCNILLKHTPGCGPPCPRLVFPQSLFERGLCGAASSQHCLIPPRDPHTWLWGDDQQCKPGSAPKTCEGRETCSNSRQSPASLVLLAPPARKAVTSYHGEELHFLWKWVCCRRYLQLWKRRQRDLWGALCSSSWRGQVG